jgi:hypothetical protein
MNRFWATLLGITLVGSVAMNFFGPSYPPEKIWDVKTFFAVYGFIGCVAIIYVSKALGKYWLLKHPGYYDPHRAPAEVGEAGEGDDA